MGLVHAAFVSVFYGLFAVYKKFRHGVSRQPGHTVLVCCLLFGLRLCLAGLPGGNSMADLLAADLVAFFSFGLWEELVKLKKSSGEQVPSPTDKGMPFGKKDVLIIGGICLFYGVIAFWNLGIRQAPVTEYPLASGESVILELDESTSAQTLSWYLKDYRHCTVTLESRNTQEEPWGGTQEITMERVFCWGSSPINVPGKYLRLTNTGQDMAIGELVLQDWEGGQVIPVNRSSIEPLFDEGSTFPEVIDYRSGTYFDETYYARTAYEFLHGMRPNEITHPPLGKLLTALGAACFGATPFGFRFVGTVFGILMLPFLYLLGRGMTKSRLLGGLACFLFAFDFMHFTQTRIATIDVYITFFTIVMFYFMYRYSRMSFYDQPLGRTLLPLGTGGVSFGLGIACKWTGFYAGAGLAVVFFRVLHLRYREYRYALERPEESSNGISHAYIVSRFRQYTAKTLLFCVLFFLVVPFGIYVLSYLPFVDGKDSGLFARMWENQRYMLRFHTGLKADHPYASPWYQWPVMIRPVFYYSRILDDTMRQGISAFGNPLVWWAGIPAFFHMVYLSLKRKDRNARFLCVAYAFCYLPWCLVDRCTFAYHYFPSVPFVVCMVVYSLAQWRKHMKPRRFAVLAVCYGLLAFGLFVLFYPVISGMPVSVDYVSGLLRWMDSWVLVQ